jgi:hypothetical protein
VARIGIATNTPFREVLLVDAAVGLGGQNLPEDVMAVQYLLRVASEKAGTSDAFQPPGEKPISIDGSCGRQTQTYISFFQAEVNRRQHRKLIEPDGRVDSVRSGSGSSSITHTFYTILALNAALRSRRGDAFHLEDDPLMPAALKSKVFLNF